MIAWSLSGHNPVFLIALSRNHCFALKCNMLILTCYYIISHPSSTINHSIPVNAAFPVEVSNIGYTQAAREQSREGWRFAEQIRPDLDCGKT